MQSRTDQSGWLSGTRGFTLIELLVVIVIISILVAIALPNLQKIKRKQMETQTATNVSEIQKALEAFGVDNNGQYPFRVTWYDAATVNAKITLPTRRAGPVDERSPSNTQIDHHQRLGVIRISATEEQAEPITNSPWG